MEEALIRGSVLKGIFESVIEAANDEGWYLTEDDYTGNLKLVGPWDSRTQRHVEMTLWD